MPEKNSGHKKLNRLDYFDYLQIWSLRFSAALGGVILPVIFYELNHPGTFTQAAICLTELLPIPAFGIFAAIDIGNRLKREGKIK